MLALPHHSFSAAMKYQGLLPFVEENPLTSALAVLVFLCIGCFLINKVMCSVVIDNMTGASRERCHCIYKTFFNVICNVMTMIMHMLSLLLVTAHVCGHTLVHKAYVLLGTYIREALIFVDVFAGTFMLLVYALCMVVILGSYIICRAIMHLCMRATGMVVVIKINAFMGE